MKDLECPNCGGAEPKELSAGVFECKFCGQHFVNERIREERKEQEKRNADYQLQMHRQQMVAEQMKAATKIGKRTLVFVGIFLVLIFALVAYMVSKSMSEANQMREDMMKQFQQQ